MAYGIRVMLQNIIWNICTFMYSIYNLANGLIFGFTDTTAAPQEKKTCSSFPLFYNTTRIPIPRPEVEDFEE